MGTCIPGEKCVVGITASSIAFEAILFSTFGTILRTLWHNRANELSAGAMRRELHVVLTTICLILPSAHAGALGRRNTTTMMLRKVCSLPTESLVGGECISFTFDFNMASSDAAVLANNPRAGYVDLAAPPTYVVGPTYTIHRSI